MKNLQGYFVLIVLSMFFLGCKDQAPDIVTETIKENPNQVLNKKLVGESANDLLSADQYKVMQVEIQFVEGFSPSQASLDNMKTFLLQRLHKPEGIEYIYTTIKSPNKSSYSVTDIDTIEKANRTVYSKGDTIGVYFFFADAGYDKDSNNSKVLGIAYRNTSMALFQKTIIGLSGGINQPDRVKLETVVLNHEFGHILGLVNVGSPMVSNHQDNENGHHCNNTKCLMHYTVETGNVVTNLIGSSMPQLDAQCLEDLKANGGK